MLRSNHWCLHSLLLLAFFVFTRVSLRLDSLPCHPPSSCFKWHYLLLSSDFHAISLLIFISNVRREFFLYWCSEGIYFHHPILLHHQLSAFFHQNLTHYSHCFLCSLTLFHHWCPPVKNVIFISWSITLQNCKFPSCNRLICFLWAM